MDYQAKLTEEESNRSFKYRAEEECFPHDQYGRCASWILPL
jgi:hypothetical protein